MALAKQVGVKAVGSKYRWAATAGGCEYGYGGVVGVCDTGCWGVKAHTTALLYSKLSNTCDRGPEATSARREGSDRVKALGCRLRRCPSLAAAVKC